MAAPIPTQRISSHTRSISLPSRSHPSKATVEVHLCRLKASEAASTSSKLSDLKDLFDSVDDMLQLPLIQQSLSHKLQDKCVEDVLDACGITKDVLSQMKECVQDLESSLRRRKGGEAGLANEIRNYMISQKKVNKKVSECLRNLRRMEKKQSSMLIDEEAIVTILREVEKISLLVLKSLLLSISQQKTRSKSGSLSFVSKLMRPQLVACEGEDGDINEVKKMNAALHSFNNQKLNIEQVQILLQPLEALDRNILELEDGLESVFRRLVKTRVSLLNILSQ